MTTLVERISDLATRTAQEVNTLRTELAKKTRVVTLTDVATITPNADTTDLGLLNSVSQGTTFANPSGTPVAGQKIMIRVKSSAAQTLTFGTKYRAGTDISFPMTTVGSSKVEYLGFIYHAIDDKWDLIAHVRGF